MEFDFTIDGTLYRKVSLEQLQELDPENADVLWADAMTRHAEKLTRRALLRRVYDEVGEADDQLEIILNGAQFNLGSMMVDLAAMDAMDTYADYKAERFRIMGILLGDDPATGQPYVLGDLARTVMQTIIQGDVKLPVIENGVAATLAEVMNLASDYYDAMNPA